MAFHIASPGTITIEESPPAIPLADEKIRIVCFTNSTGSRIDRVALAERLAEQPWRKGVEAVVIEWPSLLDSDWVCKYFPMAQRLLVRGKKFQRFRAAANLRELRDLTIDT